ncbi:hypothetical protein DPMN_117658 [Dreissena polymorpha]|uniref:Uncharacterized protein n=1 Tax=Dreissena polymorpha TaxID=45954 RepID=A0A9D4GIN7_DREPO|nr:hypothetical protein DPMN_117658 [Dreissena polymorpha]
MKFHDPWHKRSRVINRKPSENCPPSSSHETNVLSKFHENWAKNVTSTVFTCFHYIHIEKNAPPTRGNVFSPIPTIFKLIRDISKTNVLTNFHDDWAKIVTRVFTMFLYSQIEKNCHYIHIEKNAPPTGGHENCPATGGHVFQRIGNTFELNQDIIKTNILTNFELGRDFIGTKLLTKFHEDGTRNVASRTDGRTYDGQRPFTKAHLSNQVS